jgi:LysR family transcriptional regulator, transcriptional activator of the cysJI operon
MSIFIDSIILRILIYVMEDHRFKAFCLVVEAKSFSKAAKAKFMTQSAMSHLIKNLEEELGLRLLIRRGKSVSTTPAGKIFYEQAKQILKQYQDMECDIYSLAKRIKGPLSIGASITTATYLLPQVLYEFSKKYPEVQINLKLLNMEKVINGLFDGDINHGLIEGSVKDSRLVKTEIADDEIVFIASDDNPLTKKKILKTGDFMSQNFIMPELGSGNREFFEELLSSRGINIRKIKISMTLDNPELIIRMVQSGLGIAFVSKWSAFKALQEDSVKIIPFGSKKLYRKVYLISLDYEPVTMVSKTFFEFMRNFKFFMPF